MSVILLPSCKPKSSEETVELTVIKFEEASDSLNLTDNFKDISCIQLEMTENSVVGEIKTILNAEGNLVVLAKDYEVFVFNKEDGKYIRHIGSVGEGPEEFITATEICYDPTDKTILVFDGLKREFIVYSLTGEFVERFKAKGNLLDVNSIVRASDGTMLTCNNLLSDIPDQSAYTIIDRNLSIENIDPFFPLIQPKIGESSVSNVWGDKPMSACGDELKFVKVLNDTLCTIKEGTVRPLYTLDFGKEILTKEKAMEIGSWDAECLSYCMKHKLFTSVRNMFETSRYLLIDPDMDVSLGYYWIDKKNERGFHIASTYYVDKEIDKVLRGTSIMQIKGSTEKDLISCFEDSITLQAFKDQIDAIGDKTVFPESEISAIKSLDPEGNPFLIIYSH